MKFSIATLQDGIHKSVLANEAIEKLSHRNVHRSNSFFGANIVEKYIYVSYVQFLSLFFHSFFSYMLLLYMRLTFYKSIVSSNLYRLIIASFNYS